MTRLSGEEIKCPVCGEEIRVIHVLSTNTRGYSDLDLRPSEMQRSVMYQITTMCKCGNVFMGNTSPATKELVHSDSYQNCDGIKFKDQKSIMFYRAYLIDKEHNPKDIASNFTHLNQCIWACDDSDDENNIPLRKIALNLVNQLIENEENEEAKTNYILIKADLLRRSGQFDKVLEEYEDIHFDDPLLELIVDFQYTKSEEKDDKRYSIASALLPIATSIIDNMIKDADEERKKEWEHIKEEILDGNEMFLSTLMSDYFEFIKKNNN